MNQNNFYAEQQEKYAYFQLAPPQVSEPKFQVPQGEKERVLSYFIANPPKYDLGIIQFDGVRYDLGRAEIYPQMHQSTANSFEKNPNYIWSNSSNEGSLVSKSNNQVSNTSQRMEEEKGEPIQLTLKPKYAESVVTLQFRNPTASFSTRWDVIYKTLLRDWKRFFYDCFQMKKMRKNKRVYHLSRTLPIFVSQNFNSSDYTEEFKREIEFYLGCLVYPKEMTSSKVAIYGEAGQIIRGAERTKKLKKVKELHSYLYNFSMDKCEKFFRNPYLSAIFEEYLKSFAYRANQIETIKKNVRIYHAAIGLIRRLISYYKSNNS